jgi:hypothetical protein
MDLEILPTNPQFPNQYFPLARSVFGLLSSFPTLTGMEDVRLQKYMRDHWKWSEIFAQFLCRTQGAVRLRGHMLRQEVERKSSH